MSSESPSLGDFHFKDNEVVEIGELIGLYESVGWVAYTSKPALMAQLLPNSLYYRVARDKNQLVGLIRVVGDGVSIVYVQDLLVRPEYQGCGLGKALLYHVLDRYKEVRQVVLLTDDLESTKLFYEVCGFQNVNDCQLSAYVRILK